MGPDVAPYLIAILEMIAAEPARFDELAAANVSWIGGQFLGEIRGYIEAPPDGRADMVRSIFVSAYRFFCEFDLNDPREPSMQKLSIANFVHGKLEEFSGMERQQLVYAAYLMPAQIIRRLLSNPAVRGFQEFSSAVEQARTLKETWDHDLNSRTMRLNALAENVAKVSSEYNFVGLVHGFTKLRKQKLSEQRVAFWSLFGIGLVMLSVLIKQASFILGNIELIDKLQKTLLYSLPALVAVEIISLYFFRVVLAQFRSVRRRCCRLTCELRCASLSKAMLNTLPN